MTDTNKPPIWYWIVSVIALIWNALGVMNYLMQAFMSDEVIANLPADERVYYENIPAWATGGFAIAVFAGLIGSIMLLMKKSQSKMFFIVSFLGVIAQNIYWMFLSGMPMDEGRLVLPVSVILFAIALIVFSHGATKRGWTK